MAIPSSVQRLSPGDLVTLYDLDCTRIGAGVFRFTAGNMTDQPVRWRGNQYLPIPINASGFEKAGRGTLPTPTISIMATDLVVAASLTLDDLRGATVTRWQTFSRHLDNGGAPDWNQHFPIDVFKIERKKRHSTGQGIIEWELSAAIDQEGRKIPGRIATRDSCAWKYRTPVGGGQFSYDGVECPYTGSLYFNENGDATTPNLDRCGKRLTDCKKRFGQFAELPFGAFPGVGMARY